MPGKRMWKWAALVAVLAGTGCCKWCERHCCPKPVACQPCVPCCPLPAAPAACQPCVPCCPVPAGYQPTGYTPVAPAAAPGHTQWQRSFGQNGCCE
jgi:hypothetical protein